MIKILVSLQFVKCKSYEHSLIIYWTVLVWYWIGATCITGNQYIWTCKQEKLHFLFTDVSTPVFQRQHDVRFAPAVVGIFGMALVSPDILLLSFFNLQKVQLVDTREGRVVSEVKLQSNPRGVCLIRSDKAVVTVKGKKVQMLHVFWQTLNMGIALDVKTEAVGITKVGDTSFVLLYVDSPWLEVITVDGNVVHQFEKNRTTKHFICPYFLTTSVDGYIYVSDWGTNKITELNSSLQLIQTFSSPLLDSPRGIISISPDQLLVCSQGNHRIVLMNIRTGESSILLGEQDGIHTPTLLSYCHEQKRLYVAEWSTNSLNVYRPS